MRKLTKIALLTVLIVSSTRLAYAQEKLWNELNTKVVRLYRQGQYSEALKIAEEALSVAKRTFGSDHPNVATSLNNLAELYHAQAKYAEAEPLYKQVLTIREKALGDQIIPRWRYP